MRLSWIRDKKAKRQGDPNFETTLRYPFQKVVEWTRAELENQMAMACMFNMATVEWFEYEPIRVDEHDWIVFKVKGRNYIPLPENGSYEEIKAALM